MIYCTGTITTDQGVYIDPIINIYYLSYNETQGIFVYPQIVDPADNCPIDQLSGFVISNPDAETIGRDGITGVALMVLSNDYPNCNFSL